MRLRRRTDKAIAVRLDDHERRLKENERRLDRIQHLLRERNLHEQREKK